MAGKNETMTQSFDRLNKLVGELATIGVKIDKNYLNRKFLRSLGDERTMYTVSFRQSDNLEDKEMDDLYNDLQIVESEVEAKKRHTGFSHNVALLSSSCEESQVVIKDQLSLPLSKKDLMSLFWKPF